ncbi:MAG: SMP-30/gluconolactonase/LRE family protein [Oceanococcus sp.]
MRQLFGLSLLLAVLYLCFWPVEIDPAAWQPSLAPLDDPRFAQNSLLQAAHPLAAGVGLGPEAVNVDAQGRVVTGFVDGRVMRFAADGSHPELLADTGGRPLGLDFASNGDLIVTDAIKGLLRIPESGKWMVVANQAEGVPLGFADDVVVSSQDVAYYSDASVRFGVHKVMQDFFEHRAHGRILATDLKNGDTRVLLDGLHFANGVALGPGEGYLLINETAEYRVWRFWLKGARAGQREIFIDNLPGLPDNITYNDDGLFWLALYAPRAKNLDALLPHPFLRKIIWRLPKALHPMPVKHGFVLGLDLQGEVVHNLQDASDDAFAPITSARQAGNYLFLGSLSAPSMARLPLSVLGQ